MNPPSLPAGQKCPILASMKGSDLIRRLRKLAHRRGLLMELRAERGKGSHATLRLGDRLTIIRNPKDELKTGTLHAMLKQLGLTLRDLDD